ncbi:MULTISPECIES: DoxX family protein [unclassified Luteococcus]|uniref:DoxX family protein n=1 Tax=unclassified Luteococcus TaxID=2639923 RepID=UPI00313F04DF
MRHLLTPPHLVRDLALLVTRLLLGVILMAHGWQKFSTWGLSGTAGTFKQMGVPAPQLSAAFAAVVELVGGAALILGIATPVVALLAALNMFGAYLFAHTGSGIFVKEGGWELVGAIGAAALTLVGAGAGRFSIDGLLGRGRTATNDARQPAAAHGATARDEDLVTR